MTVTQSQKYYTVKMEDQKKQKIASISLRTIPNKQLQMEKFSVYLSLPGKQVFRLLQPRLTLPGLSRSGVLSLGAFIIDCFPLLTPPNLPPGAEPKVKATQEQPWEGGCYHPFECIWGDYLSELILKKSAVRHNDTLYFELPLPEATPYLLEAVKSSGLFAEEKLSEADSAFERIKQAFGLPEDVKERKRKIGFISYHPRVPKDIYAPRGQTREVFMGHLYQNDDWTVFYVKNDEKAPSVEELSTFYCVMSPGSMISILDPPAEIPQTIYNLLEARKINPKIKYFGACFGIQLLCKGLKVPIVKKELVSGIEPIKVDPSIVKKHPFLSNITKTEYIHTSYHFDHVTEVPQGFDLLAWGGNCAIEGLVAHDGLTFATQFHGEYTCKLSEEYQKKLEHYSNQPPGSLKFYIPEKEEMEKANIEDSLIWLKTVCQFINHEAQ